jgi:hypothetical protein
MLQDTVAPATPGDRYAGFYKLWVRVIQRAIYDWVAWRDSSKLEKKKQAELAETWLFKPNKLYNGFENICEMLDIDPEAIRARARRCTKDEVLKAEHIEREGRDLKEPKQLKTRWVEPLLALSEGA